MNNPDYLVKTLTEAEAELARLTQARERAAGLVNKLRTELASLKASSHQSVAENHTTTPFSKNALPEEKVRLFADLFRGRDDVFARLWISKTSGKKGYSPVCEYEWQPGKTEARIYDYVDEQVPMLARMFKKRLKTYRAMGYAMEAS
jgi:hypothetical protein